MDKDSRKIKVLKFFGRMGFVGHGLIFICVGTAACILIPRIHEAPGFKGAMLDLVGENYGKALILLISTGLTGFALWRFMQAFLDAENKGTAPAALFMRFIYTVLGLFYLWLAWTLITLLWSGTGKPGGIEIQHEVAWLLGRWYGIAILGITVLILIGLGIYQFSLTVTGNFRDTMLRRTASTPAWVIAGIFGRIGFAARGVMLETIAILLIGALIHANPHAAGGQGKAITALLKAPFGMALALTESVGLIVYGLFETSMAKYRYVFRSEKDPL